MAVDTAAIAVETIAVINYCLCNVAQKSLTNE